MKETMCAIFFLVFLLLFIFSDKFRAVFFDYFGYERPLRELEEKEKEEGGR